MIHFTLEGNPGGTYVDACEADGIRIAGRIYRHSLLLTPDRLLEWSPRQGDDLVAEVLEQLLAFPADVYLVGTGVRQRLLPTPLLAPFYRRGLGVEIMHSAAACRTFNILATEGRRPVAGILFEAG